MEADKRTQWHFAMTVLATPTHEESSEALKLYNQIADLVMQFGEITAASFNRYNSENF